MLTQDKGAQPTGGGGAERREEEGKAAPEKATGDLSSLALPSPLPPLLSTYYVPGWGAH